MRLKDKVTVGDQTGMDSGELEPSPKHFQLVSRDWYVTSVYVLILFAR